MKKLKEKFLTLKKNNKMKASITLILLLFLSTTNTPQVVDTSRPVRLAIVQEVKVDTSIYEAIGDPLLEKEAKDMKKLKKETRDVYQESVKLKDTVEKVKVMKETKEFLHKIYLKKSRPE